MKKELRNKKYFFFILHTLYFILISLTIFGCAVQRLPEGGPVDQTSPEILSIYPPPNTTYFIGNTIAIEFSEYVDRRSVESAIFFSPYISDVEYEWSGTELEIHFTKPLRKNITYVLTIGTDVVDVNNRNKMANAFSLAFSTGENIDKGSVVGKIYNEKSEGIIIFTYRLNDIKSDTLNPSKQKPDYITQTGKEGTYTLSALANGTYRVIAVRDEYRNLLYDIGIDEVGTTQKNIVLNDKDSLINNINFILAKHDTIPPQLLSATATDKNHLILQFTKPIEEKTISQSSLVSFIITDTIKNISLEITDFIFSSKKQEQIIVRTTSQENVPYRITVKNIKDKIGNVISSNNTEIFRGSLIKDTIPPQLLYFSLADSLSNVSLQPTIRFDFNDILQKQSAEKSFALFLGDSVKNENIILTKFQWNTSSSFSITPQQSLKPEQHYTIALSYKNIIDEEKNMYLDSVQIFHFSTINPDNFGSIEGVVKNIIPSHTYNIIANSTSKKEEITTSVTAGKFLFPQLSQGEYTLIVYEDVNSNGKYDAGMPFPFVPAEPFIVYPNPIKVRPRWPVDGIIIEMK